MVRELWPGIKVQVELIDLLACYGHEANIAIIEVPLMIRLEGQASREIMSAHLGFRE